MARNRVKRCLREVARHQQDAFVGWDVVLLAKPGAVELTLDSLDQAFRHAARVYRDAAMNDRTGMDNRTLLAVFLSLSVWYAWLAMFPPEELPVEEGVEPTEAVALVQESTAAPRTRDRAPSEQVDLEFCRTSAVMDTSDGGLRELVLLDHSSRYEVTSFAGWGVWPGHRFDRRPMEALW